MDWNFAKTQTLLFFYEYLIRKGAPQRIGHLSCLFGDKDFTNDMRAVVESSLSGLKKLLSDHPCLFKIVDDQLVYLNDNAATANVIADRDYNEDTKEYFKQKLLSYGIGTGGSIAIKSLHGHRSQAPPGIRHMSGATTKQFQRFLSQYPETFRIVDKNNVSLVGSDHMHRCTLGDGLPDDVNCQNDVVASLQPSANVQSQNLCARNCPTICEIVNVFDPDQLCASCIRTKLQILKKSQVISTVAQSLNVTSKILKCVANTEAQAVVSFNSKGSRSGTHTMMTLLEIGTPSGDTFLFDVLTCPQIMIDGGLKELLESDRIVKVIHNCRYKSSYLYEQFKIILHCVFDTQIANAVLHYQKDGTDVSKVKNLSLDQMVQLYFPFNSESEPLTENLWSAGQRPFTDEMIVHAARESLALLQLYGCMALLITDQNKAPLSHLCTEEILTWILPEEVEIHQMRRNIRPDAVTSRDSQIQTPTSSQNLHSRSLDYDSRGDVTQLESTHQRCCDCYVDKEIQTLSTGDIVMLSKTYDNSN